MELFVDKNKKQDENSIWQKIRIEFKWSLIKCVKANNWMKRLCTVRKMKSDSSNRSERSAKRDCRKRWENCLCLLIETRYFFLACFSCLQIIFLPLSLPLSICIASKVLLWNWNMLMGNDVLIITTWSLWAAVELYFISYSSILENYQADCPNVSNCMFIT